VPAREQVRDTREREELEATAFRRQQELLEEVVSWQGRTENKLKQ